MKNKQNWFWPIQLGSWALLGLVNYLAQSFNAQIPTVIHYLNAIATASGGLLITSLYRHFQKRKSKRSDNNAPKFLRSLLVATLLQSVCYLVYVTLVFLPVLSEYHISLVALGLNIVPLAGLLLIWNLVYLSYHLVRQHHNDEVEKWQLEAEIQKAQFGALRSQINPHFMFNSLNNIRALIIEDPALARKMITKFSEIFRYALQYWETKEITIANEIKILNQYMELVQLQYEGRLVYNIMVEENVILETIPPMILQLLVENAVKHGIALNASGGEVFVIITKQDKAIKLVVKNTGSLQMKNELENSLGIGLTNIKERLRLLYNDQATIQLVDEPPHVIVTININKP